MTGDDVTRVLNRLTAGWDKRLADDTFQIWREELADLDFSPAYAAARELIKTSIHFPRIAEFLEQYRAQAGRQARPELRVVCPHCVNGWVEHTGGVVVRCTKCTVAS